MKFSSSKWLAYTFLVGLIPLLTRLLVWASTAQDVVNIASAADFVVFGLVLHVSIINETEHLPSRENDWKTIQNGMAIVFISIYSALYAVSVVGEKNSQLIDAYTILWVSVGVAATSTAISFIIIYRLSKRSAR
ncbi:hypothetical protein GTP81_18290 [Rugamonas sp. FT107W]|uniref:Uncharacterized protein n=1 Tax=Duganella vulcania TaxID=2692166 RepID=A0A845HHC8_9BURK|nr:hypothetical protein [Duganella vulcania]MYN18702.1 hypothetical protein [Duganella vulcania]